ncbi:MAG: DNA-binding protein [Sphingomonadales bacterium]
MSREYYSAADLAQMKLPGMPETEGGCIRRAKRENWRGRQRQGRGGGREYHISSLPPQARIELARRASISEAQAGQAAARAILAAQRPDVTLCKDQPPAKYRTLAEARETVLFAFKQFHRTSGLSQRHALAVFVDDFKGGRIALDDGACDHVTALSAPTLKRWMRAYRQRGLAGLAPGWGGRKGDTKIDRDEDLKSFCIGVLVEHPHASSVQVMEGLQVRFPDKDLPDLRNLQRWLKRWKAENRRGFIAVTNPDQYKNEFKPAFGSFSENLTRPNQAWELDSSPADAMTTEGKRQALVAVVDVFTRRSMTVVAPTSSAAAIALLLRRAIEVWGVPERVKIDNGRDYVSRHITRIFDQLGIEIDVCPPFTPEHKPHVERFFQTLQHKFIELLPGYVGHSVVDRKAIEGRRAFEQRLGDEAPAFNVELSAEELQRMITSWCDDSYQHRPHRGLKGKSPFQVAAAHAGAIRRITDKEALEVLMAKAPVDGGMRTITKSGIHFDNTVYIHPALAAHVGEQVQILLNEAEASEIYVYVQDGPFLCLAIAPELRGISRRQMAAAAKKIEAEAQAEERKALRKARRKADSKYIAQEALKDQAEAAGKLARLEPRAEDHSTPALEQAGHAARAGEFKPAEQTPQLNAAMERLEDSMASAEVAKLEPTPQDRWARAKGIEAAIDAKEPVCQEEAAWHTFYTRSAEYKSLKRFYCDFKPSIVQGE